MSDLIDQRMRWNATHGLARARVLDAASDLTELQGPHAWVVPGSVSPEVAVYCGTPEQVIELAREQQALLGRKER